jgi:hypothetical protein
MLVGKLKGKDHSEDLDVNGNVIFGVWGNRVRCVDWIHLA